MGQIVFHKPGEFHSIWSIKNSEPRVFIISFRLDRKVRELEDILCSLSEQSKMRLDLLINSCKPLITKYNTDTRTNTLYPVSLIPYGMNHTIKNYLELLLISIIKQNNTPGSHLYSTSIRLEHYEKVIAYIHNHLDTHITIDTICRHCNISATTLKNIFKKYVGIGAIEYVNKMKVYNCF